jgi:hypothetical protein
MIKYCKIKNCRYPISHTSIGHLCGSCYNFGHGIIECNNPNAINHLLDNYLHDQIPNSIECSFGGCRIVGGWSKCDRDCQPDL